METKSGLQLPPPKSFRNGRRGINQSLLCLNFLPLPPFCGKHPLLLYCDNTFPYCTAAKTWFKNQQAHDLIPMAHDLNLIGFKYGKYAVVFLYCVNLAKLELYFPEFLSPYGSKLELAKREIFVRFGRWMWNRSHYVLKVFVVTNGERVLQICSHIFVHIQIFFTNAIPEQ